jgi:broad specificity phosphatase PhoE
VSARQAEHDTSSAEADQHGSASAGRSDRSLPALVVIRHGETEWSRSGRHTGRSDLPLTSAGEQQAVSVGAVIRAVLGPRPPALVISSPRQRARRTAELAGYPPDELSEDAAEWDYGDLEGLTSAEIGQRHPDWSIWTGPVPGGEDADEVSARIDRLLQHVAAAGSPVLVFSHGHAGRCLAARWLAEPVASGQHYRLDTGGVGTLGFEHDRPVIVQWNLDNR